MRRVILSEERVIEICDWKMLMLIIPWRGSEIPPSSNDEHRLISSMSHRFILGETEITISEMLHWRRG